MTNKIYDKKTNFTMNNKNIISSHAYHYQMTQLNQMVFGDNDICIT